MTDTLRAALERLVRLGPSGHQFRPWHNDYPSFNQAAFDESVRRGELHPTCSDCSPQNNALTTDRAHQSWEAYDAARAALQEDADAPDPHTYVVEGKTHCRCVRDADAPVGGLRVTHGRHCACSACAREDWTNPELAACGMHGPSCPREYAPILPAAPPEPAPDEEEQR